MYQQGFEDSLEATLVMDHLEALGEKRFAQIAKKVGETAERVQEAYDYIKTLEPKPGRSFSSLREVRYIVPDVYVEKVKDEYVVMVNDAAAPRLQINSFYKGLLKQLNKDTMTTEYISKNLQSALRIIKSIEQRRNTIYRVCNAIIEYQYEFFEKGMLYLKPLNLRNIADEIEVHESTVSRAVNGKYIQCPNGLFEIKYFFQSGVKSAGGEGVSSESVKSVMKDMIDRENPKKPLSDQAIADTLVDTGINISRRTVAKYRDEMNILPSSKRKRF
jgi:RNA polymerase sigma-54 factor